MSDPILGAVINRAIAFTNASYQGVKREIARRGVDDGRFQLVSLDKEMDEALRVLSRNSADLGGVLSEFAKGVVSGRPEVFNESVVSSWIATEKAQGLIKKGARALLLGQSPDSFADEAIAFYQTFPGGSGAGIGSIAFERAASFVALSVIRDVTVGEKLVLESVADLKGDVSQLAATLANSNASGQGSELVRALLDKVIATDIERIRKSRFYPGNRAREEARKLSDRLQTGDLQSATTDVRARAIAVCGRWLTYDEDQKLAADLLSTSRRLGATEEATILEAFVIGRESWAQGLSALSPLDSPVRKTAALMMTNTSRGAQQALAWLADVGYPPESFDSDGRFVILSCRIATQDWDRAYQGAVEISPKEMSETPALYYTCGLARLMNVVPTDMRVGLVAGPPLDGAEFPLADNLSALEDRRTATGNFRIAASVARSLGFEDVARSHEATALWLELRDPDMGAAARNQLNSLLSMGDRAPGYVHLGLSFGIPLDPDAIEAALRRQTALQPDGTPDIAIARLALANSQSTPDLMVDYFQRHQDIIYRHLDPNAVLASELCLLLSAGKTHEARDRLEEVCKSFGLSDRTRHEKILAQGKDGPSGDEIEAAYRDSPSTVNLANLVSHLSNEGFSDRFFCLAKRLVETTRSKSDAERLVAFLVKHGRLQEVDGFLEEIPDVISTSQDLRGALAWSQFRAGRFKESNQGLLKLRAERDDPNDRALEVNLLISSGRWNELAGYIESEWTARKHRSAKELVRLAQLGVQVHSARTWDFALNAAESDRSDPHVQIQCYMIATDLGREHESIAHEWFTRAVNHSGKDGPVQSGSIEEVLSRIPDWGGHVQDVTEKLRLGIVPQSVASEALHRSSLELQLSPMVANREESDPRRRTIVPAYSGARVDRAFPSGSIGMDGAALITLGFLKVLEKVVKSRAIAIPHSTLAWLFQDRHKLGFHQPSRTRFAHVLVRGISDGRFRRFVSTVNPDSALGDLVGKPLATMLRDAMLSREDGIQRVVVRSAPVLKIGSFRGEGVDLHEFEPCLCSCLSVVEKLATKGQLTRSEESHAREYLTRNEKRWPVEPTIQDGANLYLDDLSVAHLKAAGVIERLHTAGLVVHISDSEVDQANALIALETHARSTDEVIEYVRRVLAEAIEGGAVRVDRMFSKEDIGTHPNISVIQLSESVEAVVCDDRYMNRHQFVELDGRRVGIWTTLDLLANLRECDLIDAEMLSNCKTLLRQAGVVHITTSSDELCEYMSRARTRDGALVESGELRAFRENISLVQMRGWLVLPAEIQWVNKLSTDLINAILCQWTEAIPDQDARARSQWLLEMADMRIWAGQFQGQEGSGLARFGMAVVVNKLLVLQSTVSTEDARNRFNSWLKDDVVARLRASEPAIYKWMLDRLREVLKVHLGSNGDGGVRQV